MTQLDFLHSALGNLDKQQDILVINPENAATIVAPEIWIPKDGKLDRRDFAEITARTAQLRKRLQLLLCEKPMLVVVFLHAYNSLLHESHEDIEIGNYDWIWQWAGRDTNLQISETKLSTMMVTEYGSDSPFGGYLEKYGYPVSLSAEGTILPLAVGEDFRAVSFVIEYGKGKLVFIPKCLESKHKKELGEALRKASCEENWPSVEIARATDKSWFKSYLFPEIKTLEKDLIEKESVIFQLESEYERIYQRLMQLEEEHEQFFGGSYKDTGYAIASMLARWGIEVFSDAESIKIIWQGKQGLILTIVCNGEAKRWGGEKLLKMLEEKTKGIIIINAYCDQEPEQRPASFISPLLQKFAEENNIALVSLVDFYKCHSLGKQAEILQLAFNRSGIVSPPYEEWEAERKREEEEKEAEARAIAEKEAKAKAIIEAMSAESDIAEISETFVESDFSPLEEPGTMVEERSPTEEQSGVLTEGQAEQSSIEEQPGVLVEEQAKQINSSSNEIHNKSIDP